MNGIRLEPWGPGDLPLLERLLGDPAMMEHLGGPESPEKLRERQGRYERIGDTGKGRMFRIVDEESGEPVGSVGYWEREWDGERVWETGWSVLPEFQGRGIAAAATAQAIAAARAEGKHRFLYAYPSVDNAPSMAICRKLGFTLVSETDYEYPPNSGNVMRCGNWRLDLHAACAVVRPGDAAAGRTGIGYAAGVSSETGASRLALQLATVPAGGRARAHLHEHESAVYVLSGEIVTWFGHALEDHVVSRAGEMLFVPPGLPHLPVNYGSEPAEAVIARSTAEPEEPTRLLPHLDDLQHTLEPPPTAD